MVDKKYLLYVLMPLIEEGYSYNEVRIMKMVYQTPSSISEISRELGLDYKNTHRYVKNLHKLGWVKLEPPTFSQGKKVIVSLPEEKLKFLIDNLEKKILGAEGQKEFNSELQNMEKRLIKKIEGKEKK